MKTTAQKIEEMNTALHAYADIKARSRELLASIDENDRDEYGLLTGKSREALVQYTELAPQADSVSRRLRRLIFDLARTLNFGKVRIVRFGDLVSICHSLTELASK